MAVIAGEEYWVVLYKAIADFGDLMRKAAEAKAALDALGKTSGEVTAAQLSAEQKLVAARKTEVDALKAEASQVDTTAAAYHRYNVQALFGGRSDMGAHLSDLAKELEYETLLNRQRWLGFTTPQQAYAWRQNEYTQRLLMNRAEWAGYSTADQYISYLQRQTSAWKDFNTQLGDRAALYKKNTDAALAYYNAIEGTHKSISQLSESGSTEGVNALNAALAGLPPEVTTKLNADAADGLAAVAAWKAALATIPGMVSTAIGEKGSAITTADFKTAGAVANIGAYRAELAEVPAVLDTTAAFYYDEAHAQLTQWLDELNTVPEHVTVTAEAHTNKAMADLMAFNAYVKAHAHETETVTEDVVAAGGAAGGGGGPPPVAPGPAGDPNPNDDAAWARFLADITAARAAMTQYIPVVQQADAALAAQGVEVASNAAQYERWFGIKQQDVAVTEQMTAANEGLAASGKDAAAQFMAEAMAADSAAEKFKLAMASAMAYNIAAKEAGDSTAKVGTDAAASVGALGQFAGQLVKVQGAFGLLTRVGLFGGIFSVSLWHILLDAILEFGIALGGAIIGVAAMAAAVGIFIAAGNLAQDTLGRISDRLKAVYTASSATGQAIYPLTQNFNKLANVIRPEIWQLYGDALNLIGNRMGLLGRIAEDTGRVIDRLAGRFVAWLNEPSVQQGFAHLISAGIAFAKQFGQIFQNLGQIFYNFFKAAELTHIAEDLGAVLIVLTKLIGIITGALPTWLLAIVLGMHGLYLWGGLAATAVTALLDPLRALALAAGGVAVADSALGQLGDKATPMERLKAVLADVAAGFGAMPGRITGTSMSLKQVGNEAGVAAGDLSKIKKYAEDTGTALADLVPAASAVKVAELSKGLDQAGRDTLNLAAAAGSAGPGLAQLAGKLGSTSEEAGAAAAKTGLFAGLVSGLSSIPVLGWVALFAAGVAAISVKLITTNDATLNWLQSLGKTLKASSVFTIIGNTVSQLAAVTTELGKAQQTGVGNVTELAQGQSSLNAELSTELTRTAGVAKAYGTTIPGALALMNTAQVTTAQLTSNQSKVWAGALQQIAGLVTGYRAMGQGLTALQQDVNVQLVSNSDQLKSMQTLNTAWDNFRTAVAAPVDSFLALDQSMISFQQAAGQTGAAMSGLGTALPIVATQTKTLSNAAVNLQQQFQSVYSATQTMFDAFRNAQAINGGKGDFIAYVKDAVAALIPLAGSNKAAAAEISQLAQEAGGPGTTNLKELAKWAGNIKDPMLAMYNASEQATVGTANLSKDAALLTTTLQSDLNPAMANAIFIAKGGQKPFQDMAAAFAKFGAGSPQVLQASRGVAQELLAIDKNSGQAKAQFVGFAEAMGMSAAQANSLWNQLVKVPAKVATTYTLDAAEAIKKAEALRRELPHLTGTKKLKVEAEIHDLQLQAMDDKFKAAKAHASDLNNANLGKLRDELGKTYTATANLSNPGLWGQILGSFKSGTFFEATFLAWIPQVQSGLKTMNHDIGEFFTSMLPHAFDVTRHAFAAAWDGMVNWFSQSMPHAFESAWGTVSKFFDRVFTHDIPSLWDKGWSGAVSPVVHAFDSVKSWIAGNFDNWWKTHGDAVKKIWDTLWNGAKSNVETVISGVKRAWDDFFAWFKGGSGIGNFLKDIWTGAKASAEQFFSWLKTGWNTSWGDVKSLAKGAWAVVENLAKAAWDVIAAAGKLAWDTIFHVAVAAAKSAWAVIVAGVKIVWDTAVGLAKIAWDTIVAIISVVIDIFTGHWHQAWADIQAWAVQVWNAIKGIVLGVWNAIKGAADTIWHAIWDNVKTWAGQAWNAIKSGADQAWGHIESAAKGLWNSFYSVFVSPLINFFTKTVPNQAANTWNTLSSDFKGLWNSFYSVFISPIITFFTKTLPNFFTQTLPNAIKSVPGSVLGSIGGGVMSGLKGVAHFFGFAEGGSVSTGKGGAVPGQKQTLGTSRDVVPAALTPGEYVIRKDAADALNAQYGPQFLDNVNQADKIVAGQPVSRVKAPTVTRGGVAQHAAGGTVGGTGAATASAASLTTALNATAQAGERDFAAMWSREEGQARQATQQLTQSFGSLMTTIMTLSKGFQDLWKTSGSNFTKDMSQPATMFFTGLKAQSGTAGSELDAAWKSSGAEFTKEMSNGTKAFFDTLKGQAATADNELDALWAGSAASFGKSVSDPAKGFFGSLKTWLGTAGGQWNATWNAAASFFASHVQSPLNTFFTKDVSATDFSRIGSAWQSMWQLAMNNAFKTIVETPMTTFLTQTLAASDFSRVGAAWQAMWQLAMNVAFRGIVENPLNSYLTSTLAVSDFSRVGAAWQDMWKLAVNIAFKNVVETPLQNWFGSTLPAAMEGGFKNSMSWIVSHAIDPIVGWINGISGSVGIGKITAPSGFAAGGTASRMAQAGSVAGSGEFDNVPAMLMPGEFVLRKSARQALDSAYGPGYVQSLNQADSWLGSGSRGIAASQRGYAMGGCVSCGMGGGAHYASGGQIAADAQKYVGHRYVFGGPSNPQGGWDCSSFASWVLGHDLGLAIPGGSWASVTADGSQHGPTAAMYQTWGGATTKKNQDPNAAAAGDLLTWNTHVGFARGPNQMVSAYDTASGTIDTPIAGAGPGGEQLVIRDVNGVAAGGSGSSSFGTSALTAFAKAFGSQGAAIVRGAEAGSLGKAAKANSATFDQLWSGLVSPLLAQDGIVAGRGWTPNMALWGLTDIKKVTDTNIAKAAAAAAAAGAGGAFNGVIGPTSETVARYLLTQGADKAGAAGIAATISGESGTAGPESVGTGGFGLIGWTGNTIGLPPGYTGPTGNVAHDWAVQLPGIIGYARARPGGWPGVFATIQDPVAAGDVWSAYEAPKSPLSDTRPALAQQLFAQGLAAGGLAAALAVQHLAPGGDAGVSPSSTGPDEVMAGPQAMFATGGTTAKKPAPKPAPKPVPKPAPKPSKPVFSSTRADQPYHSTTSVAWNDAVDAAWAAQVRLDDAYSAFHKLDKGKQSSATQNAWRLLDSLHGSEVRYWNSLADLSKPTQLNQQSYFPVEANLRSVAGQLNSSSAIRHWLRPLKSAEFDDIGKDVSGVYSAVMGMARLWPNTWGPHVGSGTPPPPKPPGPITPGPVGTITLNGLPSVNLQPFATLGGPASPVSPPGSGGLGFATGGNVVMPTLRDVAGQFSFVVPGTNGYFPVSLPDSVGNRVSQIAQKAAPPRSLSQAGAAQSRVGVNVTGDVNIINPTPEKPSESITRASNRLAFLGGRG